MTGSQEGSASLLIDCPMQVGAPGLTIAVGAHRSGTSEEFLQFGVERRLARVKGLPWEHAYRVATGRT